jgi:hypothetical protein
VGEETFLQVPMNLIEGGVFSQAKMTHQDHNIQAKREAGQGQSIGFSTTIDSMKRAALLV